MLANACCCDPSCLIESDDFDRANNNAIGDKWSDSNARIIDNRLGPQALGSMLVLTTKDHISETMVVDVTMSFSSGSISLDKGIVIVNAKDSNNYLFVQIEVSNSLFSGTAVSTKLKFYRRSGGVNTQLGSTRTLDASNALNNQQVRVCYDGTYLKAAGYQEAATKITDGFKAGLSSEGSTTIYHDNFKWYAYKSGCPKCISVDDFVCQPCLQGTQVLSSLLVLDFGAGGWTNEDCTVCVDIKGEFVLAKRQAPATSACNETVVVGGTTCWWDYGPGGPNARFLFLGQQCGCGVGCMIFALTYVPSSSAVVASATIISFGAQCVGFGLSSTSYANYQASLSYAPDCSTLFPLTLTKVNEYHVPSDILPSFQACSGTLPATIEVREV